MFSLWLPAVGDSSFLRSKADGGGVWKGKISVCGAT